MNKNIILARPNLFIVKEMKKLMTDCTYSPIKIERLEQLEKQPKVGIVGIVISTGLHSPVEASYIDVLIKVRKLYPTRAVILASMIDAGAMKRSVQLNFDKYGITGNLFILEEIKNQPFDINPSTDIIIIQKSDITDVLQYSNTKNIIQRFFR